VFDLGGGTLYVPLLDRQHSAGTTDTFTLAGVPRGPDPLGGEDLDTRLALSVLEEIPNSVAARLRKRCRTPPARTCTCTCPRVPPQPPDGQSVQISREQLEQLVTDEAPEGS
jgi:molecular chaperone DnaK (HSP70)